MQTVRADGAMCEDGAAVMNPSNERTAWKCFVIMPYADAFDDVFLAMRQAMQDARTTPKVECLRLDQEQVAGRIVGRLERELRDCDLCVADLTGVRPNILWEVGFAMALHKPVVLVSQGEVALPFDLHDMQHLRYEKDRLRKSLSEPLQTCIEHTVRSLGAPATEAVTGAAMAALTTEMREVRTMLNQFVGHFLGSTSGARAIAGGAFGGSSTLPPPAWLRDGVWIDESARLVVCVRRVRGGMMAAIGLAGDERVHAAAFDFQTVGDYAFGHTEQVDDGRRGFVSLRRLSDGLLGGERWLAAATDPAGVGAPARWQHAPRRSTPIWAERFFTHVERDGLTRALAIARKG